VQVAANRNNNVNWIKVYSFLGFCKHIYSYASLARLLSVFSENCIRNSLARFPLGSEEDSRLSNLEATSTSFILLKNKKRRKREKNELA
jgi:hypothetical protein